MPAFTTQQAPDITGTILGAISPRHEGSQTYNSNGPDYDVAIGGIPFFIAASADRPYVRQTAPLQKPQFDISAEPGEQSLSNYWVRSETSWHRGAGINFYEPAHSRNASMFWEPGADLITQYRYKASVGVDVWTRDQVTLLKQMTLARTATAAVFVTTGRTDAGSDCFYENGGATNIVQRRETGLTTTYTSSGMNALTRVVVAGNVILVGGTTGIDSAPASATGSPAFSHLWTIGAGATVTPYYVKSRIVASINNALYQLPLAGGAITGTQLLFTHPDPNWVWTAVTDGPDAIYASGYSNAGSNVFKFLLLDNGAGTLPTLGQAYEIATMPTGERINVIKSYLGAYIGIGTNRGLRVGQIDVNGDLTYGPLSYESLLLSDGVTIGGGVQDLEGHSSFIYGTINGDIDGTAASVRINLGQPLPHEDLRYAYSYDAQTHAVGVPTTIAFLGSSNQVVLGVQAVGSYLQSATLYEPTGYLLSGRIRFRTTELKDFVSADLNAKIPGGSVVFSVLDENASETTLTTLGVANPSGYYIAISQPIGFHQYLSFRTTLTSAGGNLSAPTLEALLIRALPYAKNQRLIQFPLNCADHERDAAGAAVGYEGFAFARLSALESLEENFTRVQVQDFITGENYTALIEELAFSRVETRAGDGRPNFGGILKATMRKL